MATFTITSNSNFHSLTSKAGNDTYNVNGATLTFDADVRYGPNVSTSTGPFGDIVISSSLGGKVFIDGSKIKAIPFTSGSGNVPASGTTISQGSVTAELICVMSLKTGGTVTPAGNSMPSSGYIKVRNVSGGSFISGSLSGIEASASAAEDTSFIEMVGIETKSISVPRLGEFTVSGEWFFAGTTTGNRHQTIQLPAFDASNTWYPGVWIETAENSGIYEFWANVATRWATNNFDTDSRSKVVNITGAGLLYLGGDGSSSIGYVPPANCRVKVGNIIFSNAASGTPTANAVPHATLTSRYRITSTTGKISLSKANICWNGSISGYIFDSDGISIADQLALSNFFSPISVKDSHVGMTGSTIQNVIVLSITKMFFGGTIDTCSAVRGNNTGTLATIANVSNFKASNLKFMYLQNRSAGANAALYFNTCDNNSSISNATLIGGFLDCNTVFNSTIENVKYCDAALGSTSTSNGTQAVNLRGSCNNCVVNGIETLSGISNVHPYSALIALNTCSNITIRNIGNSVNKFDCGTANQTGYLITDSGNSQSVKLQRIWIKNLRTDIASLVNSSSKFIFDNVYSEDATKRVVPNSNNSYIRSGRMNSTTPTTLTAVFGTHFYDLATSDTAAKAGIFFTEKTSDAISASSYSIVSGGITFLANGTAQMKTTGDQVVWTFPWAILGWTQITGFNTAGTNLNNHTFEYDLDTGSGFSGTYKTMSNENLQAESISPTGFMLKIRITCTSGNTSNILNVVELVGSTTLSNQNNALRPLSSYNIFLTGLQENSEITALVGSDPSTATIISKIESSGVSAQITHNVEGQTGYIQIMSLGYVPIELPIVFSNYDISIPIQQRIDRIYLNP